MADQKAFAYMSKTFEMVESTNGYYHLECPSCREKRGRSGSYKPEINRYYCFQPGCEYGKIIRPTGTSIYDLIQDVEKLPSYKAVRDFLRDLNPRTYTSTYTPTQGQLQKPTTPQKLQLPYGYTNVGFGDTKVAKDARSYLEGRGYDPMDSVARYQLGYIDTIDPNGNNYYGYLVIPFFNGFGDLIYYQLRGLYSYLQRWDNPDTEKFGVGKTSLMFNEQVLFEQGETFIHEGATDGMTTHSPGTLGLVLSDDHVDKISRARKDTFFFMYDAGAWLEGLNNAYKCMATGKKIYAIHLEEGEGDPNELGPDLCEAKKSEAILITPETYATEMYRIRYDGHKTYRGSPGLHIQF